MGRTVTESSSDKTSSARNMTRPVGRILRFLLGSWLIALVIPYYRTSNWVSILIALGVALGLLAFYVMSHLLVSNCVPNLNRWLGALLAWVPAVLAFILGGVPGQVGVLSFAGVSLLLASVRGDPGCEVMSIPGLVFKKHTRLACLLFSPIDWLEAKIYAYIKGAA